MDISRRPISVRVQDGRRLPVRYSAPMRRETTNRHQYADTDRAEMASLIPPGAARLLDVGCSWGGFGAYLSRVRPNIEVTGIDPSIEASATARERLHTVYVGSFPDVLPDDVGLFDCISFNDTLEHFVDPWEILDSCKSILGPSGRIVASIPNIRFLNKSLRLLLYGEQGQPQSLVIA